MPGIYLGSSGRVGTLKQRTISPEPGTLFFKLLLLMKKFNLKAALGRLRTTILAICNPAFIQDVTGSSGASNHHLQVWATSTEAQWTVSAFVSCQCSSLSEWTSALAVLSQQPGFLLHYNLGCHVKRKWDSALTASPLKNNYKTSSKQFYLKLSFTKKHGVPLVFFKA